MKAAVETFLFFHFQGKDVLYFFLLLFKCVLGLGEPGWLSRLGF